MLEKLKAYLRLANIPFNDKQEDNTHLIFNIEGFIFIAEYDKSQDPTYFRMMLPLVDKVDEQNEAHVMDIAMDVNSRFKVGKVIKVGEYIWITVDNFIYGEWDLNPLFARDIAVAKEMINDYRRLKNEQGQ
jgi:hypothetical protein